METYLQKSKAFAQSQQAFTIYLWIFGFLSISFRDGFATEGWPRINEKICRQIVPSHVD